MPWTHVALPALAAVGAASLVYFSRACGSYDAKALFWEARLDVKTGKPYALNLRTGETEPGWQRVAMAEAAAAGARLFAVLRGGAPGLWRRLDVSWAQGLTLRPEDGPAAAAQKLPQEPREVTKQRIGIGR